MRIPNVKAYAFLAYPKMSKMIDILTAVLAPFAKNTERIVYGTNRQSGGLNTRLFAKCLPSHLTLVS